MTKKYNETISKSISKLEVNKKYYFKNFKELCNTLGLDYVTSDSKNAILNTLKIYCLIEHTKNSHSYTIVRVDEFLEAINRCNAKTTRKRLSIYAEKMYPIFLNEFKTLKTLKIIEYRNNIFSLMGFTRSSLLNYRRFESTSSTKMILDEFKQNCMGIILQPYLRAIDNLEKNNMIDNRRLFMVTNLDDEAQDWHLADNDEQKIIENELLKLHPLFDNLYKVFLKKGWKNFVQTLNFNICNYDIKFQAFIYEFTFSILHNNSFDEEYNKLFGNMTEKEIANKITQLRKSINTYILQVVQKYNDREIQYFIAQRTENKKEIFKQFKKEYGDEITIEKCADIYKSLLEKFTNDIIKID